MKLCKWGLGGTHCRRGRWAFPSSQPYIHVPRGTKWRGMGGGKRRLCCIILQGNDWRKWSFRSAFSRVDSTLCCILATKSFCIFRVRMCVIQSKGLDLNSMQNLRNYCQKKSNQKCGKLFTSFNQGKLSRPSRAALLTSRRGGVFFYVLENSV